MEEYECAFKQFDINGDGVISTAELGAMLRSIGLKPSQREIKVRVNLVTKKLFLYGHQNNN